MSNEFEGSAGVGIAENLQNSIRGEK